jgi:predicted transcriptional regulator
MAQDGKTLQLTTEIVSAFVTRNAVPPDDLAGLISTVHQTLAQPDRATTAKPKRESATPAQIRRSITPTAIISFEDGRPYKLLKRHLRALGLTPEAYRAKWGLPADYPMVAAEYSSVRSTKAKELGLGTATRGRAAKRP